jgi:hypothetical protein
VFFVTVYPQLGHWMRRDTNVYFCFATFALGLLSVAVVVPAFLRVQRHARLFIAALVAMAIWELVSGMRILYYQL